MYFVHVRCDNSGDQNCEQYVNIQFYLSIHNGFTKLMQINKYKGILRMFAVTIPVMKTNQNSSLIVDLQGICKAHANQ